MSEELINYLEKIETWDSEETFLRDALVLASAKLIRTCHEQNTIFNVVTIPPLLRQVHENFIVIIGLSERVITTENFINEKHRPKNIMNSIKKNKLQIDEISFDIFNEYLIRMKEMLNKYSHTSFEGVMTLFTERFQVYESQQFNRIMMKFIISLIEAPFLVMANYIYKLNLELPKAENIKKELKELNNLKYISRHFPDSIKDFISKSDVLRNYYQNLMVDFKKTLEDFKIMRNPKENI